MIAGVELSRRRFLGLAGLAAIPASGLLSGCSNSSGSDTLKVGVLAPFTGNDADVGTVASNSLQAAVRHLNATGGLSGRKLELLLRDIGTRRQAAADLYQQMAGTPALVAILWCGRSGLDQLLPLIHQQSMPVVSVFQDLYSAGTLYPQSQQGRSLFQVGPPDDYLMDALAAYASGDRGYASAALLQDPAVDPNGTRSSQFRRAFAGAGLTVTPAETFPTGATDMGPQLGRLRAAAPQALYIDAMPADAATAVEGLATMASSYVDDPTAKGAPWHPQVFGSLQAMGDGSWAITAGDAAETGSVTATHLGGLPYLPTYTVRGWMERYLGREPTGGEDLPADALYTVLQGVRQSGGTDRHRLVQAVEGLSNVRFASLAFGFTPNRHLARTPDEVAIMTLEHLRGPAPTDPPYQLGREWQTGNLYAATPAGPTQLVRPTLAGNLRAHPDAMHQILSQSWGTQCTKLADGSLSKECKVH